MPHEKGNVSNLDTFPFLRLRFLLVCAILVPCKKDGANSERRNAHERTGSHSTTYARDCGCFSGLPDKEITAPPDLARSGNFKYPVTELADFPASSRETVLLAFYYSHLTCSCQVPPPKMDGGTCFTPCGFR